jgi:hypothetical protein
MRLSVALMRLRRLAHVQTGGGMSTAGSSSSLVMEARQFLGTNPTSRRSLWCAHFTNMVLERAGWPHLRT